MSIEWMISSSGLMVSVLLVRVLFKKKIRPVWDMPYGWSLLCGFCFRYQYREPQSVF